MSFQKSLSATLFLLSGSLFLMLTAFNPSSSMQYSFRSNLLQDTVPDHDTAMDDKLFERVEVEASFPGGDRAWRSYLEQNLNPLVPVTNGAPAGNYTVTVQFVVHINGKISDVRALTNHGFGMEQEVIRIIRKSPSWEPAMQNGRKVRAYRKQPVTFQVIEEKKKKKRRS